MAGQKMLGLYLFEKNIFCGLELCYVHMDEINFHCKLLLLLSCGSWFRKLVCSDSCSVYSENEDGFFIIF